MNLRSCAVIIGVIVLLSIGTGGHMALAQQDTRNGQQIMTPISGPIGAVINEKKISSLAHRNLQMYEAAMGDLSLCKNRACLDKAREFKEWFCAAQLCDGTDHSKAPMTCFKKLSSKLSKEAQERANPLICAMIKSPSTETRKAVFPLLHKGEYSVVRDVAYILALKGSSFSCENYIKSYVGAYGPKWWEHEGYTALSGCRILAHDRTREQEENDFDTWTQVLLGSASCSAIVNGDMRNACYAS